MKTWKITLKDLAILAAFCVGTHLAISAYLNYLSGSALQEDKSREDINLRIQRASSVSRTNFMEFAKKEQLIKIDLKEEFTVYTEYNLFRSTATPSNIDVQVSGISFEYDGKKCAAKVEVEPTLSQYIFYARIKNANCEGTQLNSSNLYLRRWDGGSFVFTNFSVDNGILAASTRFERMALFIKTN